LLSSHFFFTPPATPVIYTLSLHDALPISRLYSPPNRSSSSSDRLAHESLFHIARLGGVCLIRCWRRVPRPESRPGGRRLRGVAEDRKSTRLNSSHVSISYAVFCLKKKTQ